MVFEKIISSLRVIGLIARLMIVFNVLSIVSNTSFCEIDFQSVGSENICPQVDKYEYFSPTFAMISVLYLCCTLII